MGKSSPKTEQVEVTQEIFDLNPDLATQGVEVGSVIEVEKGSLVKPEAAPKVKKGEVSKVLFRVRHHDTPEREFSAAVHGDNFMELADQFAKTNESIILKREDL